MVTPYLPSNAVPYYIRVSPSSHQLDQSLTDHIYKTDKSMYQQFHPLDASFPHQLVNQLLSSIEKFP